MEQPTSGTGDRHGDDLLVGSVRQVLLDLVASGRWPSAAEVVQAVEEGVGLQGRIVILEVLQDLAEDKSSRIDARRYFESLARSSEMPAVLQGDAPAPRGVLSSIDTLLERSRAYRSAPAFGEMIRFMGRFKEYAPFNNMLVRLQNPTCSFFATEKDWERRFRKRLKEDARPMLILAPMHPVLFVYDIDQVQGGWTPAELERFAKFEGTPRPGLLSRMVENARVRDRILVQRKPLSSTYAGFATTARGEASSKMRIVLHDGLDDPSAVGVLCHELAHVYLGHLGCDSDHWWPSRSGLARRSMEIEAEAVAYLVTARMGLQGASEAYVSRYLGRDGVPSGVSLDSIAKVAGRIEDMAERKLSERRAKGRAADTPLT